MKHLNNIDLNKNELQNAAMHKLASAPSSPVKGQTYFNTTDNKPYVYNGTSWISMDSQDTDTNQKIKSGSTTFGDNAVINIKAGTNVTVTPDNTSGSESIEISATDTGATSVETTGDGNAVTSASYNSSTRKITLTKGSTFLTAHQSIKVLDTTQTTAQTTDDDEAIAGSGSIKLHKIAKTGTYSDLIGLPTLGTASSKDTGTSSGNVPVLDSNGKLDTSILPALAITDTFVVSSENAMLALTAQVGDVAVRTDLNKSFILKEDGASTLSHWQELLTPTDAVSSVNGKTGVVILSASDVDALPDSTKYGKSLSVSGTSLSLKDQDGTVLSTVTTQDTNTWRPIKVNGTEKLGSGTDTNALDLVAGTNITLSESGGAVTINATSSIQKYSADNPALTQSSGLCTWTVTHSLGTKDVIVGIEEVSTGEVVYADIVKTSTSVVTIKIVSSSNISAGTYRVTVIG